NDMSSSLDKLLDRTGLIYLLAFQPVRVPENGKFHALKVKVRNRSYQVSARSGYYEPKSQKTLTPIEKTLAQSAAVTAALPKTEATLASGGIKYYGSLSLAPGDYTLRTLVRNNETGRFGVTITPMKISSAVEAVTLPPLFVEEGRHWIMIKGKSRSDAESSAE